MQGTKLRKSPTQSSTFSILFRQIRSVNLLHLCAALLQVGLGSVVVLISVLGLINPFWVSIYMVMAASIVTMVGLYFLFTLVERGGRNRLLQDAIRRIMNAQN
ncbi:MAG: hypothetical protein R3211_04005 [Balneolaceae bacterium]|nr:hypothetical protein [Balneolaceae bacterium]